MAYIYIYSALKGRKFCNDYNNDELWEHYAMWNKQVTKRQVLISFIRDTYGGQITEYNESTMVVIRAQGREICKLLFNGYRVSENNYGDGWWWWLHNNVNEFKITELYTLKWLRWYILC